jgi:hypothetical protein
VSALLSRGVRQLGYSLSTASNGVTWLSGPDTDDPYRHQVGLAASDERLVRLRVESARLVAEGFSTVGTDLHVAGHLLGADRGDGLSPFGHGSDEVVAVSVLLRIAGQLVLGSVNLFDQGIPYAAAALLRQSVEIEYLTWAFEAQQGDAERWLRSDRHERERFFSPAKLRRAANDKFGRTIIVVTVSSVVIQSLT